MDWGNVDADEETDYEAYLDGIRQIDEIQAYKQRSYELLDAGPGDCVLDAGCGTGADAAAIAEALPVRDVVGVDASERLLDVASDRVDGSAVQFQRMDVTDLSFADDTFAASRADRVLQHLPDPDEAIESLRRVTEPGGRVVLSGPDWTTATLDVEDTELADTVHDPQWSSVSHPRIGAQLYRRSRRAGLTDVAVDPWTIPTTDERVWTSAMRIPERLDRAVSAGTLTAAEADQYRDALARAADDGTFFGFVTGFTVAGTVR